MAKSQKCRKVVVRDRHTGRPHCVYKLSLEEQHVSQQSDPSQADGLPGRQHPSKQVTVVKVKARYKAASLNAAIQTEQPSIDLPAQPPQGSDKQQHKRQQQQQNQSQNQDKNLRPQKQNLQDRHQQHQQHHNQDQQHHNQNQQNQNQQHRNQDQRHQNQRRQQQYQDPQHKPHHPQQRASQNQQRAVLEPHEVLESDAAGLQPNSGRRQAHAAAPYSYGQDDTTAVASPALFGPAAGQHEDGQQPLQSSAGYEAQQPLPTHGNREASNPNQARSRARPAFREHADPTLYERAMPPTPTASTYWHHTPVHTPMPMPVPTHIHVHTNATTPGPQHTTIPDQNPPVSGRFRRMSSTPRTTAAAAAAAAKDWHEGKTDFCREWCEQAQRSPDFFGNGFEVRHYWSSAPHTPLTPRYPGSPSGFPPGYSPAFPSGFPSGFASAFPSAHSAVPSTHAVTRHSHVAHNRASHCSWDPEGFVDMYLATHTRSCCCAYCN